MVTRQEALGLEMMNVNVFITQPSLFATPGEQGQTRHIDQVSLRALGRADFSRFLTAWIVGDADGLATNLMPSCCLRDSTTNHAGCTYCPVLYMITRSSHVRYCKLQRGLARRKTIFFPTWGM